MSGQVNFKSGEYRAMANIVERCSQDPQLGNAVLQLLDVCEEMDKKDPGAGLEFVKAIRDTSGQRSTSNNLNPRPELQTLIHCDEQLAHLHGAIQQLTRSEDAAIRGTANLMQSYVENVVEQLGSATAQLYRYVNAQQGQGTGQN